MEKLPDELCLHILRHVSLEDLTLRCSATSRALRRVSDDADLWHHHLDQYHPRWRDALRDMGVDATVTPLRKCVRYLTEAHDPDGESGCCRHHLTKGAACTCCTCRRHHRHHRAGQRWQWGALSSLVDGLGDDMRQMVAAAYDANAATPRQLIRDYNEERRRERRRNRRRRRHRQGRGRRQRRRGPGRGRDDSDDSDDSSDDDSDYDDDRGRELIAELERMGVLELRNKGSRRERVRWTDAAHRDLRPPLQGGLVCYTNAELCANLLRAHPELLREWSHGTPAASTGSSLFGAIGGGLFGGSLSTSGGRFGSTRPSTSLFATSGDTSSSLVGGRGGTSSLFGGGGTSASTASISLFGAPAASTSTAGGGLFGGSLSTSGGRFGSTGPSTSLFGSTPPTPSTTGSGSPSLGGFGAGTIPTTTSGSRSLGGFAPAASTGSSLFGSTTPGASSGLGSLGGLGGLTGGAGVPGAGTHTPTASPQPSASAPAE